MASLEFEGNVNFKWSHKIATTFLFYSIYIRCTCIYIVTGMYIYIYSSAFPENIHKDRFGFKFILKSKLCILVN